jgi:hypothetical protein
VSSAKSLLGDLLERAGRFLISTSILPCTTMGRAALDARSDEAASRATHAVSSAAATRVAISWGTERADLFAAARSLIM